MPLSSRPTLLTRPNPSQDKKIEAYQAQAEESARRCLLLESSELTKTRELIELAEEYSGFKDFVVAAMVGFP